MTELERLMAKDAITETLVRYCRGIDRGDLELAKSAYCAEGYDEHGPARGNAHEVMDRVFDFLAGPVEICQHRISNVLIAFGDDEACVESSFYSLHVDATEEEHVWGRYLDRFACRDGAWRIAHRRVVMDYSSLRPRGKPHPYMDGFTLGRRSRDDASYALFAGEM